MVDIHDHLAVMGGPQTIIGRAIVIHEGVNIVENQFSLKFEVQVQMTLDWEDTRTA